MFERFSPSAIAVSAAAEREALLVGDRRIGTEHLLLGLLDDPASGPASALGFTIDRARSELRAMDIEALAAVGLDTRNLTIPSPSRARLGARPSPRSGALNDAAYHRAAKAALERAMRESLLERSREITAEHILAALLTSQSPDPVAQLLQRLSVDPADVSSRLAIAV